MLLYLGRFYVLGNFIKVTVQLCQLGLNNISTGGPPASHQDDCLVPHVVHTQTDLVQLLQHALETNQEAACYLFMIQFKSKTWNCFFSPIYQILFLIN